MKCINNERYDFRDIHRELTRNNIQRLPSNDWSMKITETLITVTKPVLKIRSIWGNKLRENYRLLLQ